MVSSEGTPNFILENLVGFVETLFDAAHLRGTFYKTLKAYFLPTGWVCFVLLLLNVAIAILARTLLWFFTRAPLVLLMGAPRSGRTWVYHRLITGQLPGRAPHSGAAKAGGTAQALVAAGPGTVSQHDVLAGCETVTFSREGKTVATARLVDTQGAFYMTRDASSKLRGAAGVVFIVDSAADYKAPAQCLHRLLLHLEQLARPEPLPLLLGFNKMDVLVGSGTRFDPNEATAALEDVLDGLCKQRDPTEPLSLSGISDDKPFHFADLRRVMVATARLSAKAGDVSALPLWLVDVLQKHKAKRMRAQRWSKAIDEMAWSFLPLGSRPSKQGPHSPVSKPPLTSMSSGSIPLPTLSCTLTTVAE